MMSHTFFIYKWKERGFLHSLQQQTFSVLLELQGSQFELG